MEIIKFEYYNFSELENRLRNVHIKDKPEVKIYKNASIKLWKGVNPEEIHICQYYARRQDLEEITSCREALLPFGVDIFKLLGFVRVFSKKENGQIQVFDVLPPVVEISRQDNNIPLLCDGLHRLYVARKIGSTVNVVLIDGVDPQYPYYAFPNENGWKDVKEVEDVPSVKKNYRRKDYKSLFRDFNTAFLNVTQIRKKRNIKPIEISGELVGIYP